MRRLLYGTWLASTLLLGCGGPEALAARTPTVPSVLTGAPEQLELEPAAARRELFRELVRSSSAEAGHPASAGVLFPIARGEALFAAPALEGRSDLLLPWDGGSAPYPLVLVTGPDGWSDDPRDGLQGLSEREAVSLVAAALLQRWGVAPTREVQVDRALGAPYAAAYVDGILRINPSFVYLAAAGVM